MRRVGVVAIAMSAIFSFAAQAQCPEGRPKPCGPTLALKIDRARVAILPARMSGADSALGYLSNGLVDLLAPQFTGETGPLAVDPADAVAAWTRFASAHATMTKSDAIQVAQLLG